MISVLSIHHCNYFKGEKQKTKNSCICHLHSLPKILEPCFCAGVVRMAKRSTENMPPPKGGSQCPPPIPRPRDSRDSPLDESPGQSRQDPSIQAPPLVLLLAGSDRFWENEETLPSVTFVCRSVLIGHVISKVELAIKESDSAHETRSDRTD